MKKIRLTLFSCLWATFLCQPLFAQTVKEDAGVIGDTVIVNESSVSPDDRQNMVMDADSNWYHTVVIGKQVWLQENLRTTKYRNGKSINGMLPDAQWQADKSGAYAFFNNDTAKEAELGKLYNWYAVANPAGLCPAGWHVPSNSDWNQLVIYLDPYADTTGARRTQSELAGGAMKVIDDRYWMPPNTGVTSTSNFRAFAGGLKSSAGSYHDIGTYGFWWSTEPYSNADAYGRLLSYFNGLIDRFYAPKNTGFSVRCLKDN